MSHPLHQLQLAFAYHVVLELIGVDSEVDMSELAFLHTAFRHEALLASGLVDPDGVLTEQFAVARDAALVELPQRLTTGEKLALMDLVAEASAADGILAAEEADALAAVARTLGVENHEWLDHLEGLIAAGRLRRDEAGV